VERIQAFLLEKWIQATIKAVFRKLRMLRKLGLIEFVRGERAEGDYKALLLNSEKIEDEAWKDVKALGLRRLGSEV